VTNAASDRITPTPIKNAANAIRTSHLFLFTGFIAPPTCRKQFPCATHGIVDSLYLKDLAKRTFRGVEQLALQGLHTGGRVFGYRQVPIESATTRDSYGRPAIEGVRLVIDPNQAATIRRIFERYAAGHSMKRTAIDLNHERILSPQPREGRPQSWAQSSVRHIFDQRV
jgi:Recombinase